MLQLLFSSLKLWSIFKCKELVQLSAGRSALNWYTSLSHLPPPLPLTVCRVEVCIGKLLSMQSIKCYIQLNQEVSSGVRVCSFGALVLVCPYRHGRQWPILSYAQLCVISHLPRMLKHSYYVLHTSLPHTIK